MIRYTLKCADGHEFDSWFRSVEAFDALAARGHLLCEICGGSDVTKSMMAPQVASKQEVAGAAPHQMAAGPLSKPGTELEKAVAEFRRKLEENSTYVGGEFAREARQMHLGEVPERQIHGEATASEAKSLWEDGVPVLPIPGVPKSKAN